MELSERDKDRARFHLGYTNYSGISHYDVLDFEQSVRQIRSEVIMGYIKSTLDTLDQILVYRDPTSQDSYTQIQKFAGDINRTRIDQSPVQTMKLWEQIYNKHCSYLANYLFVRNFNGASWDDRFIKGSTVFASTVPGNAMPNTGSRIFLQSYMA